MKIYAALGKALLIEKDNKRKPAAVAGGKVLATSLSRDGSLHGNAVAYF